MRTLTLVGLAIILSFSFSFPQYAKAQTTQLSRQEMIALIAKLTTQLTALRAQISNSSQPTKPASTSNTSEWEYIRPDTVEKTLHDVTDEDIYEEEDIIHQYLVRNDRLYENDEWTNDTDSDEYKVWEIFRKLVGSETVAKHMYRYATYDIGPHPVLGFVQYLREEEPSWGFAINTHGIDLDDEEWSRELIITLIHEFGHMVTLDNAEVNHKMRSEKICTDRNRYYIAVDGGSCAEKSSYLQKFVEKFWDEDRQEEARKARRGNDTEEYYDDHEKDFVTWYAATSPEEDIAESFTNFILTKKPTVSTNIEDQKILFFYDFPEFVTFRNQIRAGAEKYFK